MLWHFLVIYVASIAALLLHDIWQISINNLKALLDQGDLLIYDLVLQVLHTLGF